MEYLATDVNGQGIFLPQLSPPLSIDTMCVLFRESPISSLHKILYADTTTHRMQTTVQNTYFNEYFGRCDFEEIDKNLLRAGNALGYILKYIEKTGEKIVYSRGLPMYLVSDIIDEDVITRTGEEDKKLLLSDDFQCWEEGELIGRIGEETKRRMKTSN